VTTNTTDQQILLPVNTDLNDVVTHLAGAVNNGSGSGIESRLVKRYLSAADRTARNPTPATGELSIRADQLPVSYEYYNGSNWILMHCNVVTTSDQSWTSNVTAADVANTLPAGVGFSIPMAANSRWRFSAYLITTSSTGQLSATGIQPSGCVTDGQILGVNTSGSYYNTIVQNATATTFGLGIFSTASTEHIHGHILNGSTAGTWKMQFAQGVSSANTSFLLKGSIFTYEQLA
jgi:hypothetical protein